MRTRVGLIGAVRPPAKGPSHERVSGWVSDSHEALPDSTALAGYGPKHWLQTARFP